jgi:K(+)-stimulated pyrophosphate-energized sodium pump
MNVDRLKNVIQLIHENLFFLLKKTTWSIMGLMAVFSLLLEGLFFLKGGHLEYNSFLALWLGTTLALLNLNVAYPVIFRFLGNKEIEYMDQPVRLFDKYYAASLILALIMIILPMGGLIFDLVIFGGSSAIYYLLGVGIVSFITRLGGGIFAKGADLACSMVKETDSRSPAAIADKIGDYLNNGLALSFDLIESLIGILVAMILFIQGHLVDKSLRDTLYYAILSYPFFIILGSIAISFISGFLVLGLKRKTILGNVLKPIHSIYVSLFLIGIFSFIFSIYYILPSFSFLSSLGFSTGMAPYICIVLGLVLAVFIGIATDYYTSDAHQPVREMASFAEHSAPLAMLNGLAVGMKSLYWPLIFEAAFFLVAYRLSGFYGIIMMSTGFMAMAPTILAASLYAPFADNITGLAKMESNDPQIIQGVQQLDIIGNTLSALAKNYASNATLIVVFSLFLAFIKVSGLHYQTVSIFHPLVVSALFFGGLLPYILSSTLIRAVSYTAIQMAESSINQIKTIPYLLEKKTFPDMRAFILESGVKIIRDLFLPTLFVLIIPIFIGKLFGAEMLATVFMGIMISGIFLSMSFTNTGAVLDNSKKMMENGHFGGTGTRTYDNAVMGDLFGDALKDLAGPSLNNFVKVMITVAIIILPLII